MLGFSIVFLYLFGWRVYSQLDLIQLLSVGFGCYAIANWRHHVMRAATPVAALFAITFIYCATVFVIRGVQDLFPLLRIVRGVLTLLGGVGIAIYFERRLGPKAQGELIKYAVSSVALHGALMLAMYLSHPVRSLVYAVTKGVQYANRGVFLGANAADVGVRVMGLTYGLASTSVLQVSAAFQLPNLARYVRAPYVVTPLFLVLFVASAAVAGRSGLLLAGLLTPVLILCLLGTRTYRRIGVGLLLLAILFVPLAYLAVTVLSESHNQQVAYTLAHLQELSTIITTPERSPTLRFLSSEFLLPTGAANILFGVGSFGRSGAFYLASDIGFVQQLFAYGIFGIVLLWSPLFCMLWIAIRNRSTSPLGALGFALTVVASLLFNGKEESLYERCYWSFQILLWLHVIVGARRRETTAVAE